MKKNLFILLTLLFSNALLNAQQQGCNCFLLTENNKKLEIEKVFIQEGNTEIFNDTTIITPVFSLGEGLNGDMIQKERRKGTLIAQCKNNMLKYRFRDAAGNEKPLPDMNPKELEKLNIRVNVKGRTGNIQKAFLIENYNTIKEDNGPVIDMFGGKLTLQEGDYIITTETKKNLKTSVLSGSVNFKIIDNWMVVPVKIGSGEAVDFIVDLAATSTVISKTILPESAVIRKMEMVEYSANGNNTKEATMQGATGSTQAGTLLGKTNLEQLEIGEVKVDDVDASVLISFPEKLQKAGIVGILGSDVLLRANVLTFHDVNSQNGTMVFGDETEAKVNPSIQIPFSIAGGLLFADGTIGEALIKFLLDTGARETILSNEFAKENHIDYNIVVHNKIITGIDGKSKNALLVEVPSIGLGRFKFQNERIVLGDVAALQSFGLSKDAAILGMTFFRKFSTVSFDFNNRNFSVIK
ncbi:MAG: hypothetical protein A2W85_16130 [Bacteroidetes bacterium GWF2_41_31]|nr:MAG: hypothetical protein A2W85_16130 [Bacteroidetes bacterium GWF2_41_31]